MKKNILCFCLVSLSQNLLFAQSIAGNGTHSLAICTDLTVRAWGGSPVINYGNLGDGLATNSRTPVQAVGLTGITGLTTNAYASFALKSNGTVWSFGNNSEGQLGDNTVSDRYTPVQVFSGVSKIAGSSNSTIALKTNGTVWGWGFNSTGEIGDNSSAQRESPVQTVGLSGVIAIDAGWAHSMALKSNGTVWAWGDNNNYQLGDNTVNARTTPVQTIGLSGVIAVEFNTYTGYALKSDGTVWAWGNNTYGTIGDNTTVIKPTAVQVTGLTGVTSISGGQYSVFAFKNDGTVWGWGYNGYGQLGDGTTINRYSPVQMTALTGVAAISGTVGGAGGFHHLVLKNDGTLWATGLNSLGEIGDNTTVTRYSYVQVQSLCSVVTLPVELLNFYATPENNSKVRLDWATATEINNDYFTLERSKDGFSFSDIEQVNSNAPGGNSTFPLYYTRYDEDPYIGLSYYRLRQTDFNGHFSYSPIRSVYLGVSMDIISIYPNPSSDGYLHYVIASKGEQNIELQIIDILGRVVVDEKQYLPAGITSRQLSTESYCPGLYLIRISNEAQEKVQKQFVIK